MTIYSDLCQAIKEAATSLSVGSKEFSSAQVREWIKSNHSDDWALFEPSFQAHFSWAVNSDADFPIERVPGKYFYRLIEQPEVSQVIPVGENPEYTSQPSDTAPTTSKIQREGKLYQTLRDWLESKGYQSSVTSTSKSGGIWGNPDVTGMRLDELPVGPAGIECATIEAKLSVDSWKYYIFEAVSHKRFAHRAWYAFAVGTDSPSFKQVKDAELLAKYAEKYRVGVLVVFISANHYEQLTNGDCTTLELGPDDVRIEVLWPALYETVQASELSTFIRDVLNVKNYTEFGGFGRT